MPNKPSPERETLNRPDIVRPRFDSQALFGNGSEIIILHNDQEYRLRRTRNGRLILNK